METVSRTLVIPDSHAGLRLDQAAAQLLPEFSRSRLKAWIERGWLTVEGAQMEAKSRIKGGETLVLNAELEAEVPVSPEPIPLDIVGHDPSFFVIDKPAGLVVHPGAGIVSGTMQNALLALDPALALLPRAGIVHRLDKDTSGLLVVARTLQAQQGLARQIARRAVKRVYEAACQGVLTGGGVIAEPIGRHPHQRTRMAVRRGGRAATTRYRVLQRFRAHTHIEVELETGRTHQIRVHMAHIRAPLVGDPVYGGRGRIPSGASDAVATALGRLNRQALHATALQFVHPVSGRDVSFVSPLPEDIETLLGALASVPGADG
jgi:23S rRNA pseudouridine1911/1915/1917 synthase